MAMQASFYLELTAGLHRFGVRSDDGFLLTAGLSLTNSALELGRFDGDRGSGLPGGSTEFEFLVEKSGVYALRLTWYEGVGGADLELFSVDRTTLNSTNVVRTLVNDSTSAQSVKAFMGRVGTPTPTPEPPAILSLKIAGGVLSFTFATQAGVSYKVQSKTQLSDASWQDAAVSVTGDGSVKRVDLPITGASGFYRVVAR